VTAVRQGDTDRFYALMYELSSRIGGPRMLSDCRAARWPVAGVLFFCEVGETRPDGTHRVTRVDTHALTAKGTNSLWQRLCTHRGCVNGSRPGGGNHRASNSRLRLGTALLARGQWPGSVRDSWRDKRADCTVRDAEYLLEVAVTEHIGGMPFLWLAVRDRADRAMIVSHTIALLSRRSEGLDPASARWLGLTADAGKVRTSALWNVDHVDETYDPAYLDTLERLVHSV
jgi:hypothetical protein